MGDFIGIRIDGRLVAMAGTRMRFPGYTEISGVCTHPDYRGRGLARRLSAAVSATIAARGDRPFFHAWKTNTAAITIYEALGFMHRTDVNVAELVKRRTGA
jgi:predicted GNAT family acetyltransferase